MHSRKTTAIPDFFFDPQSKVTLKSNKISNIYLLRVGISPSVRQNSEVEFKMMESEIERQNLRNSFPLQTTVRRHQKHEAPYKMTASAFEEFELTFIVYVFLFFFFNHCG